MELLVKCKEKAQTPWVSSMLVIDKRFTRLPFVIFTAPKVYRRKIYTPSFKGFLTVEIIVDNFLIHGEDQTDADQKLRRVLDRNRKVGLMFNPNN